MEFFQSIRDAFVNFFEVNDILKIIHSGDYSSLGTFEGLKTVIGPLFPVVTVIELGVACFYRKYKLGLFKLYGKNR